MGDNNTNLLEAFRTNVEQRRLEEPKALSSGIKKPAVPKKRKAKNVMIKLYVNGALLLISAALVFVAYRLAVLPEIFPNDTPKTTTAPVDISGIDFQGAATFANNFAFNWLSGKQKQASKYNATGLKLPENAGTLKKHVVNWNIVWQVIPETNKSITVIISASVSPGKNQPSKLVHLAVPIVINNGSYGVNGLPTYVPEPAPAKFVGTELKEADISEADTQNINQNIKLFLSEYYGGSPEKTSVYFADGSQRSVLANAEFTKIEELKIFSPKTKEDSSAPATSVIVEVTSDVKIDGTQMLQKIQLNMSKNSQEAKKWFIEGTNPHIPLYVNEKQQEPQTPANP